MKINKYIFISISFVFCSVVYPQKQEKILFVGNSFTFYYNIPSTVEQMALAKGLKWKVYQSTAGGASLKDHWLGNKNLNTHKMLKRKRFSKVVFQDYSSNPLTAIDSTVKYLHLLQKKLRNKPTQYLYATWAYPGIAGQSKDTLLQSLSIEEALSQNTSRGESVVKVGRAFDVFRMRFPEIELLSDDAKHTNPNGSYLAACVFFAQLSGQSAMGLPRRKEGNDENGKKIYYYIVQANVAEKCQAVADEIVFSPN